MGPARPSFPERLHVQVSHAFTLLVWLNGSVDRRVGPAVTMSKREMRVRHCAGWLVDMMG
jgi:hypothetical protein